ncbi:MAG TPA: hypothetical protein VFS33_00350 [Gemmatimonadales bacterium]|jgi:hypothetical protein|nr:hypothetical protein [Gemmatimonadales bacterium]
MTMESDSSRKLMIAIAIGTLVQVGMVVAGHYVPGIARLFAPGGMLISALAGVLYASSARPASLGASATGGAIAGGACALIGILVSYLLGDVPAAVLGFGTASSAVTGAVGGVLGRMVGPRTA